MNTDSIDYFNHQAATALAKHQSLTTRAVADGSFARKQWMAAASEALLAGASFSDRASRKMVKPWDGRMTAARA